MAKILVGKTKRVIERHINKLYPLEYANRDEVTVSTHGNDFISKRRESALMAYIKMKLIKY